MNNTFRNILIFIVTFTLVFGLCIVPSFADTGYFNGFAYIDTFSTGTEGSVYDIGVSSSFSGHIYLTGLYSNSSHSISISPFYWAYVNNNLAFVVDTSLSSELSIVYPTFSRSFALRQTDKYSSNSYNIYVTQANVFDYFTSKNSSITVFPSVQSLIDFVDNNFNGGSSEDTYNAYFDIPCGNVAYIKTGNDNTLTLSCTMPEYSKLTGSTGSYWTNTMQIAYGVPSYPVTGTTFPLSSMSNIQWFRSTEGRDLLGRTKKALFLDTTQGSDNFIVIYNPTYRELTTSGQGNVNPSIRVQCSALIDYHMYALTGEYNSQGTISSYSIDGFSDPYVGTPTSDNEEVIGTNSSGSTPNVGGTGNEIGGDGDIIQYIQGIQKTLDTFASSFISLLKAPISHIQALIAAGTDYFNVIRGLYGWLPDVVQSTINSAMVVSISVGVIALLL